jgi:CheY-like chemotaxis protein
MSHELRTPLNAVLGFSELLESDAKGSFDAAQRSHLDHIQRAGRHLQGLIDDLLDVSLIEAGQIEVDVTSLDPLVLIDEALRLSEPLAAEHGVCTAARTPLRSTQPVLGDSTRLRQVLLNLLSNAIKYNRCGGTVRVDLCDDGELVHIDVTDTGMGMTPEQLDHLYEPFNRLGREHGTIEGKGIGLALTRQLVHLMGGELHAQSEEGLGTRMRVSLRRGTPQAPPAPPAPTPAAARAPAAGSDAAPRGCVLDIEDNPVNVILVQAFLSRWEGVRLEIAANGSTGIRLARALQPDLVLLDMHLPDMGGADVLQALRGDESTRGLRVVALSASAMPEDIALARQHGVSDYWTKPLDFARFLDDVGAMLDGADATPAASERSACP